MVGSILDILETKYADAPSWLVTTTCDYIRYTNDFEILDEIVDVNGELLLKKKAAQ